MRLGAFSDFAALSVAPHERRESIQRLTRIRIIMIGAVLWSGLLIWRLYSLQIADFERWEDWASKQHLSEFTVAAERGTIVDRNGELLAVSVPSGSIYVRPRQVKDKAKTAETLAKMLELKVSDVEEKLNAKSPFVWVKRQVHKVLAEDVVKLDLPGVGSMLEPRRYYPYNHAAATLIGRVGIDGLGLSGIEAAYEKQLQQSAVRTVFARDALGKPLHVIDTGVDAKTLEMPKGADLQLTIDAPLQVILDEELEQGRIAANAKNAFAVMVDADTGEILALSEAPLINFNETQKVASSKLKSLVVESVFEPGSIMKPLVAAYAIEQGVARPNDMIDCEHGRYQVGRKTIKDVHGAGVITLNDVVVRSSNIGMTKIGMRLGKERLYRGLRDYGFGSTVDLGLPGQTPGILRPVEKWALVDVATHSFGQGVAVTPLQIVRAVSVIANGGYLPNISIVKGAQSDKESKRILSTRTAELAQEMMYGVVENEHGTGKKAALTNVRVGGKTGTAQKARKNGRGYEPGAYIASFVGFVDASKVGINRRMVLAVMVDEPKGGVIYGGVLAAPIFKRVMQRSLHRLTAVKGLQTFKNVTALNHVAIPLAAPAL